MDDLFEIRRLVEAYAIAMDLNDQAAFGQIFVSGGGLDVMVPGRDRPIGRFRGLGRDGIGLIARLMSEVYQSTQHNITTHHATVAGDIATGVTYCVAYHVVDGPRGAVLEAGGVKYEEEFVRTAVGWRIGVRKATRLWTHSAPVSAEPLHIDLAAAGWRTARTTEGGTA